MKKFAALILLGTSLTAFAEGQFSLEKGLHITASDTLLRTMRERSVGRCKVKGLLVEKITTSFEGSTYQFIVNDIVHEFSSREEKNAVDLFVKDFQIRSIISNGVSASQAFILERRHCLNSKPTYSISL